MCHKGCALLRKCYYYITAAYAAAVLFRMSEDKPPDYRHRLSSNLHQLYHNEVGINNNSHVMLPIIVFIVGVSIRDDGDATSTSGQWSDVSYWHDEPDVRSSHP